MVNAFFYSNIAVATTLSGNINNSGTSATVAATTGWPTSYPFIIAIDYGAANEELVQVTNNAAGTLTIVRGFGGTSAVAHSVGAVVRHAYNAQDATDFRTHEAATSGVHGVTGALVGATQSQTLTNKTLTSPTINAGALSGTFTGTPTFSGNVTHSGEIILTNLLRASRASATDSQYESRVTADANARWFSQADGKMFWGPGTGAVDVVLYREAANTLRTDDQFRSVRSSGTDPTWISQRSADTGARWYITADGVATWGDGAGAMDTNLFRSAANILRTDDALSVGGTLTVGATTWTTFTPTIGGGGSVTWSDRTGYYYKLGKMVAVVIFLTVNTAGSGVTPVSVDMPSNVDRSCRQVMLAHCDNVGSGFSGSSSLVAFISGLGPTFDRLRTYNNQNISGDDLAAGATIAIQGWYREA